MIEILTICASALFGAAAVADLGWRRIPNAVCAGVAVIALLRLGVTGADWGNVAADLAAALAVLLLGALVFERGWLGGGDVKLSAAAALWVGFANVGAFLSTTALAGGALAMIWVGRRACFPRLDEKSATLPYGLAIATGGIVVTMSLGVG